jgi:hypothetical protein
MAQLLIPNRNQERMLFHELAPRQLTIGFEWLCCLKAGEEIEA